MKSIYILTLFVFFVPLIAYTQTQTLTIQVAQSTDDAEESEDSFEILTESSDLELVFDDFIDQNNQTVGIRFLNVTIPTNATVQNAYIQFHADDTGDIQTDVTIKGEASASSLTFAENPGNISSRNTTIASVNWSNVPAWTETHEGGMDERTPDLSILVNEMIANNGWTYGSPLTFIITGTGSREAESFDGIPEEAPILVVEFTLPQVDVDLGILELKGVDNFMLVQNDITVSTVVKNYGINPIDSFELSYVLNNVTQTVEKIYQTIAPNDSYEHTFNETLNLTTIGAYRIEAEVFADMDNTNFNNTIELDFEVIPDFSNVYFETSSVWKYLDDGSNLGTDWTDINYDDSAWFLGAGEFGFGDGDETTILEDGSITYYFRKVVDVQDIGLVSNVIANLSSDDAVVIYVNGQEVTRSFNLPQGPISATTIPDRDVPHDFENHPVKYEIPVSYFNTGLNIVAIELHNISSNDVDLSFSCEFISQPIEYSIDGPYVFHRGNEIHVKYITENGPKLDTFPVGATPTLTCDLPNGDSFSFDLKESHQIPESEYEMPDKFLVTSDIEGQIEAYVSLLQNASVIDENYNWTYGEGHLYFIGDMFDRGDYVTQCLWLLYKLEQEAQLAGGQVHFIVGNHEVLNFEHDYRYVRDKYFENSHFLGEMLYDLHDQNTELGQWLRSKNILEKAGDSAILVHAGLSPQVKNLNLTFDEINDFGRLGMDGNCPGGNVPCQIVNGGSDEGVYWYRGIANEELSQAEVENIISSFNGENMIFGHTVFPQVSSLYQHKVLVVDVDIEDNFDNGFMEALYFEDGCYHRLVTNSNNTTLTLIDSDCSPVSTAELTQGNSIGFDVIPSVFKDEITIQYSADTSEGKVFIHSVFGDLLESFPLELHQNNMTINTAKWNAGTYVITLQSESQIATKKAIKY